MAGRLSYRFCQGGYDFAEGGEGLVDVCALLEPGPLGPRRLRPLGPRQVHQRDLTYLKEKNTLI